MKDRELEALPPGLDAEIRGYIAEGHTVAAIKRLREATGCGLVDASEWVNRNLSHRKKTGKPCPFCGEPLRTDAAKQCFECGRDWHDDADATAKPD
jgi:hypothetical protein